jgi:hypothetical protein
LLPIKKGTTHMIQWIKYDPENPLNIGDDYLISDGKNIAMASWYQNKFCIYMDFDMSHSEVTHYAHINLPGEEAR